jgi:hypothetical protein
MVLEMRDYALYEPSSISCQGIAPKQQQIYTITRGVMPKTPEIFTNIAAKTFQIGQKTRLI